MFDHAPVVAAAAMFTSLQNDVLTAEAMALEVIGERVTVPPVYFNKIEPVAFAPAAYLNMGDTMSIRVMTAAYDSNEVALIKWSDVSFDDADSRNTSSNKIQINANKPGVHTMFGKIGVKQHDDMVWKPWSFKYEVGQPSAFASPLELNVLYSGHKNRIAALASGYPTERISLSLFAGINLKADELDMYHKVHEALGEKIPKPDLLLYLRAGTDTLMQRIALRDRPYERQMERSYIDELNRAYEAFFAKPYNHAPVLKIDTDDLNIVQNAGHLKRIENRLRETLELHPYQPSLPLPAAKQG